MKTINKKRVASKKTTKRKAVVTRKVQQPNIKQVLTVIAIVIAVLGTFYLYSQAVGGGVIDTKEYAEKLEKCKDGKYTLEVAGLTGKNGIPVEIKGVKDGVCVATMELPNNGLQTCRFPEANLEQVAQDYVDSVSGSTTVSASSSLDGSSVESNNPLQKYLEDGTCKITGY